MTQSAVFADPTLASLASLLLTQSAQEPPVCSPLASCDNDLDDYEREPAVETCESADDALAPAEIAGGPTMLLKFEGDVKIGGMTNILDIEVPPMLDLVIKTGITWADDAFGADGGITPSMLTMLTGMPGSGKSTMMMQLADAMTGEGHNVLYNMGEESLVQLRKSTRRLRLKHGFVVGNNRLIPDVLEHSDKIAEKCPGKFNVIIIDSLQAHDDGYYKNGVTNSNTPVRVMELLTEYAKATWTAIIVVGQVTKGGEFEGKQRIIHMVDAKGELFYDGNRKSETYGKRVFQMTKNRFGVSGRHYILDIDETGLHEIGTIGKLRTLQGDFT